MKRVRVMRVDEECQCAWCGFPFYVGDVYTERHDEPFCSMTCAASYADQERDGKRLEAACLAAEFHSSLNRGNLRRKLKRGRGPVQLGMFEPAPEPEAQRELF